MPPRVEQRYHEAVEGYRERLASRLDALETRDLDPSRLPALKDEGLLEPKLLPIGAMAEKYRPSPSGDC